MMLIRVLDSSISDSCLPQNRFVNALSVQGENPGTSCEGDQSEASKPYRSKRNQRPNSVGSYSKINICRASACAGGLVHPRNTFRPRLHQTNILKVHTRPGASSYTLESWNRQTKRTACRVEEISLNNLEYFWQLLSVSDHLFVIRVAEWEHGNGPYELAIELQYFLDLVIVEGSDPAGGEAELLDA